MHRMTAFKKWIFLLLICLQGSWAWGQKFTATVSSNPVVVNKVFQITFRIQGEYKNQKINYPKFNGIQAQMVGMRTESSDFNGVRDISHLFIFNAIARKTGTYKIGSASVIVNGKQLRTEPINLVVEDAAARRPQASQPNQQNNSRQNANTANQDLMRQISKNVFLRAYISKRDVYVGEQLTITYKIFTKASLSFLDKSDPPKLPGFWVERLDDIQNTPFEIEVLNGVQYKAGVVFRAIVIPQRSGEIVIDPFKVDTKVRVTVPPSRNSRDFFDSFFSRYQDVPFEPTAGAVTINVKALPEAGKPESFNGEVGSYKLDVNMDKESTSTGEPVTLRIKLSGEGNLKNIQAPELTFPQDFDIYDPKIDSRISSKSGRIRGSKSFDFLIIPLNPGEFKLPNVNFSYFDPKEERYYELKGPELSLKAEGDAQMPISNMAPVTREDIALLNQDIRFIKTNVSGLKPLNSTFWASGTFWALSMLPLALFGFLFWYKRKQDLEAGDVAGTRMKYATKVANKKLAAAEKLITQEGKSFYDEMDRAIWGYLGDKLTMNPSELNRDTVNQHLTDAGVGEETVATLTKILDDCEMALYAPVSSESEKSQLYKDTLALISNIEKQIS